MKTSPPQLEVLEKDISEISTIPVKDFMNPTKNKSKWILKTGLSPLTFNHSYTTLIELMEGKIIENSKFAIRLKGIKHKYNW